MVVSYSLQSKVSSMLQLLLLLSSSIVFQTMTAAAEERRCYYLTGGRDCLEWIAGTPLCRSEGEYSCFQDGVITSIQYSADGLTYNVFWYDDSYQYQGQGDGEFEEIFVEYTELESAKINDMVWDYYYAQCDELYYCNESGRRIENCDVEIEMSERRRKEKRNLDQGEEEGLNLPFTYDFICNCPGTTYDETNVCVKDPDDDQNQCTLTCENGGYCAIFGSLADDDHGEFCVCPYNYHGDRCQLKRECTMTCFNGGVCKFLDSGFDDDDNTSLARKDNNNNNNPGNQGQGGRGLEQDEYQYCDCPAGYAGENCQYKSYQTSCNLNCQNGGGCEIISDGDGNYYYEEFCTCPPNWTGKECQVPCECRNGGNCFYSDDYDGGGGGGDDYLYIRCDCPYGYTGNECQFGISCDYLNCQNGGICTSLVGSSTSTATTTTTTSSTTGVRSKEDEEISNNGNDRLLDEYVEFYCSCPSSWTGAECEIPCECQNQGTCTYGICSDCGGGDESATFYDEASCVCQDGYKGEFCQCQDGAPCEDDESDESPNKLASLASFKKGGDICFSFLVYLLFSTLLL